MKFKARKVPKVTPLRAEDPQKRMNYAQNGPVSKGGTFGCVTLNDDWEIRKTEIAYFNDKPFWLYSSSSKNMFYYDFDDGTEPQPMQIEKHIPHFMNCCGLSYNSKVKTEIKEKSDENLGFVNNLGISYGLMLKVIDDNNVKENLEIREIMLNDTNVMRKKPLPINRRKTLTTILLKASNKLEKKWRILEKILNSKKYL